MPNQPLRRSQRIAAKAAKKEDVVTDGNTAKYNNKKQTNTTTSTSRRGSRSRSRSRAKRRCSLQSLEEKTTLPTRQSPRRAKSHEKTPPRRREVDGKRVVPHHDDSSSHETPSIVQSATKSNKYTSTATVTPIVVESKGVKFNLGRNSIAQYIKDDPPNIVEHLTDEVVPVSEELLSTDEEDDDETTRRNEELLAEWETNFDELDTCQVSRRAIRRVSMSS